MKYLIYASALLVTIGLQTQAQNPPAEHKTWHSKGTHGAVAAGGQGAVDAGIKVLKDGGNAADSAVATILALTVTDSTSVCFGGEVPIMFYDAKRKVVEVIAGQGTAPRLATRDYFVQKGGIPTSGVESATVPALLDACIVTLERHGTKTFTEVVAPTLKLLESGKQAWHPHLARTIRILIEAETTAGGDRITGLRRVSDTFYRGSVAREIDAWARSNGSLIRYQDLATHVTRIEDPISINYRDNTIVKCGIWTQGPFLLQSLQLLEGYDLKSQGHNSSNAIHTIVEAMKLSLADRDRYYADPLFVNVPTKGLLSPDYANLRRKLIDPKQASLAVRPGDPINNRATIELAENDSGKPNASLDTTTCLVADRWGNVVAATPSGWSGVVAGETGVWLGSRLQSLNTWLGHPNVIEPGKRPRITLTPTIILDQERRPTFAISVAGGDNQDQMTLQLVLNQIDFGIEPAKSVTAPRFMTDHLIGSFGQTSPKLGRVRINPGVGKDVLNVLGQRGHDLQVSEGSIGAAPIVLSIDPINKTFETAGDPKAGRHVEAY
jgi:gamma-glutamyltranspeptidase/glutathione hydrolase